MRNFIRGFLHAFRKILPIVFLVLAAPAPLFAADFQGASAVLQKVQEKNVSTNTTTEASDDAVLRKDLKDFQKRVGALSPDEAATGWLKLVDRHSKLHADARQGLDEMTLPITADDVMAALPPPKDWSALAQAIFARPDAKEDGVMGEIGLRLLASTLTGNTEARKKEIAVLQARAEKADPQSVAIYRNILRSIRQVMLASLDDPDAVIRSLEQELAGENSIGPRYLRIPNIVSLAGAEKSEAFLRRALQKENVSIHIEGQNETLRLAQKLALEMMAALKKPQWGLINSLDSIELYEAMDKRFGQEKEKEPVKLPPGLENLPDLSAFSNENGDGQKAKADTYYLLGLISKQRAKEAVVVAKKIGKQNQIYLPTDALKAMERAGYTKALDDFFFELLSQEPGLPFWKDYVQLAAKAGKTDRMLTLARATAARDDLSKAKKSAIQQTLFRALLAAEQVEEGVKEMRRLINEESPARAFREETPGQLSIMLTRIGILLQKPEWINEGIQGAQKSLQKPDNKNSYMAGADSIAPALADLLVELNRGPDAETILTDALAKALTSKEATQNFQWGLGGEARNLLVALAAVYHKTGRHQDVVILLEKAPYWDAKDLAEMNEDFSSLGMVNLNQLHNAESPLPLSYLAANALVAVGRKEEARVVANDLLDRQPGLDRGYELLITIDEPATIGRLDQLFARDPFEERPLIWKAEVLRRQNKLEEAEKIVRQAISIDPSDGEQGPNDRLRAYAILADIRDARGDKKEAEFFRGAVNAIRLSEKADKFYSAGLLKPAIKMYEDSLKLFADAYCIQSRLAIQLSELGLHDEAEAHYRRAYELMPDSFGRVESHCFGCERAFEGQRAQNLAEKIFTGLAKKTPEKPQVHYLLGYLREEQERHAEALPHFQTAVQLDPDYLNAWKKIQDVSTPVHLSAKENDRVAFNILRLDPLSRHVHPNFEKVTDLVGLWNAVEAGQRVQVVHSTNLFSLAASKAALEKKENEPKTREQDYRAIYRREVQSAQQPSPARAVAQTPFVRVAAELFAGPGSGEDYVTY